MPCTPSPTLPDLLPPGGLNVSAPIPAIPEPTVPDACCKIPKLPPIPIPALLPSVSINPAFMALLHKGLDAIDAWEASLIPACPRS